MKLTFQVVPAGFLVTLLGTGRLFGDSVPGVPGDWQGPNCVAQITVATNGEFRANLFKQFDQPDHFLATLLGQPAGEVVNFSGDGWTATLVHGVFKGGKDASTIELKPVTRHSPTENAKPPPGAIALFDGSNLDHWARQKAKEWEAADGPVTGWKLKDGVVEVVPGAGSIITKQRFGDCKLHVEFRTLGPVNSGVYLQTRYEVGLSETYGQLDGSFCGGLGNVTDAPKPRVNASLPPFQWQTLDIDFRAPRFTATGTKTELARITVALNGVTVVEQVELASVRGAAKRLGDAATGSVMLQEHGAPIQFRNIWLVESGTKPK